MSKSSSGSSTTPKKSSDTTKDKNNVSKAVRPYAKLFTEPTQARNSFKDECDVQKIVDKFARTGVVTHVRKGQGAMFDAPEMDFREAMAIQAELVSHEEYANAFAAPESRESVTENEPEAKVREVEKQAQGASESPQNGQETATEGGA